MVSGSSGSKHLFDEYSIVKAERERDRKAPISSLWAWLQQTVAFEPTITTKTSCVFVSSWCIKVHVRMQVHVHMRVRVRLHVHVHGDHHPPSQTASFYKMQLCIKQALKMHKFVLSLSKVVDVLCAFARRPIPIPMPFPHQCCLHTCKRYKTLDNVCVEYSSFFVHKLGIARARIFPIFVCNMRFS